MQPDVSAGTLGKAINARLFALGAVSDDPAVLTRLYLSPAHRRAVDLVAGWMAEAGFVTRVDAAGSLMGRYEGETPNAPALLIGSHLDTVRNAGRYDGALGVLTAIEVVAAFQRAGQRFPFAIELLAFGDEEGVRFPTTLHGSRAVAGRFEPKALDEVDEDGITRRAALEAFGCDADADPSAGWDLTRCIAYLEWHIEQGPVLEAEDLPVGVVSGIAGLSRGTCRVIGKSGHAGTVPMAMRQDALAAAAEMVLAVEAKGLAVPGLVATVGRLVVPQGAGNVVPGLAEFSLDIRHAEDAIRHKAVREIETQFAIIAQRRGLALDLKFPFDMPAALSDAKLQERLQQAVKRAGIAARTLVSGAGHDAMVFCEKLPFVMMFVRCREGLSHHPDEFASEQDIGVAASVMADVIAGFAEAG
ncbi:MAG: allantoate amidohydrolase [Bosea sp. (in: a-proteobacteria)]